MKTIEVGQRPTTLWGKAKERLQGRSLVVHDQNGEKVKILGVTTLRRSIVGPRLRAIYEPSDYGRVGDLAFAEVDQSLSDIVTQMGKQRKVRKIKEVEIPAFNTVATGIVMEQLGSHGKDPQNSIIYSNTAPRGGEHLGDIDWHGNDGQGFVFGVLKSGVSVSFVDAGNAASFIKEGLVGLWKTDVVMNGTQFRSRDTFPAAINILSGRRGRKLIKEWIDPATIPDRPKLVEDKDQQTVSFTVGYKDGYGNLKTTTRLNELPKHIKETGIFYVQDANGDTIPVYNKLAGAEVTTGQFFLTYGSSGSKENPYIEINKLYGNAAKTLGMEEFTDHTTVTLSLNEPVTEIASQTQIRSANINDIDQLVAVDRNSYGEYGADKDYLSKKIISPDSEVLVVESKGNLTGFAVLELIKEGQIPDDYANLNPDNPPQDKWVQISTFTTQSNYLKVDEDQKLVDAIENFGKDKGYNNFGTCLSVDHPYPAALKFWENSGYNNVGTIQWVGSPLEPIDCNLYLKQGKK